MLVLAELKTKKGSRRTKGCWLVVSEGKGRSLLCFLLS